METSSDRFFPVTILGDRLHVRGIPDWHPWESSRLEYWPESDLDRILPAMGDPKIRTGEELEAVMNEPPGPSPTRKLWISESLESDVQRLWEVKVRMTQGRREENYTVTFRLPGDPIGPAGVDGPMQITVEAASIEEAAKKATAEFEGAEVVTVKPVKEGR
jgi:hypothetical protein